MWCVTAEVRAQSNEGPNLADRTFSECTPNLEIKKFSILAKSACDRSLETSRQDDCNGAGGEFGMVVACAVGLSEHFNVKDFAWAAIHVPDRLGESVEIVYFL